MSQIPLFEYRDVTLETIAVPLDLKRNAVLERFEFDISLTSISLVHGWIYWTLHTIISPTFNEFVILLSSEGIPWHPKNSAGWRAIDWLLESLAMRNPDFKVVFRRDLPPYPYGTQDTDGDSPSFIANYLPRATSKDLVKFELVPRVENRSRKVDYL